MANSIIAFSIILTFGLCVGTDVTPTKQIVKSPEHTIEKRTPFRNSEIMTARGFGKREPFADQKLDNEASDEFSSMKRNENAVPLFFPFYQKPLGLAAQSSQRPLKYHRLQTRDMQSPLKFRLNDGLRISRGFGKRSQNFMADSEEIQEQRGMI
jgi:hypothetical protein